MIHIEITHTAWHDIFSGARCLRLLSNEQLQQGDIVTFTCSQSESRPYRVTKHQTHLVGCYVEFVEA